MNKNTILAIVFLMAGTLLTTTAVTTMVPAAYADNKNKAEDESNAALADCDENDVERAGFDCFAIAGDEESSCTIVCPVSETPPDITTGTDIMSNPLFNIEE